MTTVSLSTDMRCDVALFLPKDFKDFAIITAYRNQIMATQQVFFTTTAVAIEEARKAIKEKIAAKYGREDALEIINEAIKAESVVCQRFMNSILPFDSSSLPEIPVEILHTESALAQLIQDPEKHLVKTKVRTHKGAFEMIIVNVPGRDFTIITQEGKASSSYPFCFLKVLRSGICPVRKVSDFHAEYVALQVNLKVIRIKKEKQLLAETLRPILYHQLVPIVIQYHAEEQPQWFEPTNYYSRLHELAVEALGPDLADPYIEEAYVCGMDLESTIKEFGSPLTV